MRTLMLKEFTPSTVADCDIDDLARLRTFIPDLRVQPSFKQPNEYVLTPGAWIGAVSLPGFVVQIQPKISMSKVLFLVSYAADPSSWKATPQSFESSDLVVEALVPAFLQLVARATRRGLLHGYQVHEESLPMVRGRIRVPEQVRRRFGLGPPVEVQFDEHTADIQENRLLKAAMGRLARLPIRSPRTGRMLREFQGAFEQVSLVSFDSRSVPRTPITRLNQHYALALALARLILEGTSFDLGHGGVGATSFLLNMNSVFEDFVYSALREAMGVPTTTFRQGTRGLTLDAKGKVRLEPDLSWWHAEECAFVGDVKYKTLDGIPHSDLYQLLAYVVGAQCRRGSLVFAAGTPSWSEHDVPGHDCRLSVCALDLSESPDGILDQIQTIADHVRSSGAIPTR